jgi:hypothetical protein
MSGHDLVTLEPADAGARDALASYPRCPQAAAGAQPTPKPSSPADRVDNLRAGSRWDKLKHISCFLPGVVTAMVRH